MNGQQNVKIKGSVSTLQPSWEIETYYSFIFLRIDSSDLEFSVNINLLIFTEPVWNIANLTVRFAVSNFIRKSVDCGLEFPEYIGL